MKKALALLAVVLSVGLTVVDAEAARRLGSGKSTGMQRQNSAQPAQQPPAGGNQAAAPSQAAPPNGAAPAAAAAAPRRSWMGPVAALAAGIGLAALASHFGLGGAVANMLMIALIVMIALALLGYFLRRRGMRQQPALAASGAAGNDPQQPQPQPQPQATWRDEPSNAQQRGSMIGSAIGANVGGAPVVSAQASGIPADFDKTGFERNAKAQFIALQEANDARDLERLRGFLTPEMFDLVQSDLAERGEAPQKTEVFGLQAHVLAVAQEGDRYVVSVQFTGSVRDEPGAAPEPLDEVWHLTKSRSGLDGWVIAGIQQAGATA